MALAISATTHNKMLVFSDLDGSLLDHDSYDWRPALPALAALRRHGIPLILVSSKTLAELDEYQQELGLREPVVAENGAAIHIPDDYFRQSALNDAVPATRNAIQAAYRSIKTELDCRCEAFFELGVAGIVAATGLAERQAALANERLGSEPVLWRDTDTRLGLFEQAVRQRSLRCVRGGRFLHLMGNTDKGEAVSKLVDAYGREWPDAAITSVSLGDGPNDLAMLARTDVAVIIPGKHGQPMPLESGNRILRVASHGPVGWNDAMLQLLAEHDESMQLSDGE